MKNVTNLFKIEACIGTLQSGLEAEKGGANRVELCDNLAEGGTTPSAALIQMTKEKLLKSGIEISMYEDALERYL
ncbi:MAG: copper homeostasis protein CutC, partial [Bacteroidales bacterium]|nr:copper homeostasis protein CutC [Bacteroidales bacterium]